MAELSEQELSEMEALAKELPLLLYHPIPDGAYVQRCLERASSAISDTIAAARREKKLREALRRYGHHIDEQCHSYRGRHIPALCMCGLDEALKED